MSKVFVVFFVFFALCIDASALVPTTRINIIKEAEIIDVSGESNVLFIKESTWRAAVRDQALTTGDTVRTGTLGRMNLLFVDGAQIKVHNRTTVRIKSVGNPGASDPTVLGLDIGEVWSRTPSSPDSLRINTPSATAAIRGTDWDLLVDEAGTSYLTVLKGTVELYNDFGMVEVGANEHAMAEVGKPPVKSFLVRPKDRVQWIISYPIEIARLVSLQTPHRAETAGASSGDATQIESRLSLAEQLYDTRKYDECWKIVEEVLSDSSINNRALVLKGYLHLVYGKMPAARAIFLKVLENAANRERTLATLGLAGVYLHDGESEEAGKLIRALDTGKASAEVGAALASFLAFQGDFAGAVEVGARYGKQYPEDERFPVMNADFFLTIDEQEKALSSIDAALRINPESTMAQTILGRQQYLQGDGNAAEASFRRATSIDPANTLAISELGKLLMEKGDFEASLRAFNAAVEKDPAVSSYWARRGMLMNWLDELDEARSDLERAAELNATDYQSLNALGVIALKEGRTEDAVNYFLKAGVMEPNYAEPHTFLAIAYYQLDQIDRALDELKVAKTLDPKDPVPHIVTYIIYQDTYRPMDAVREATTTLDLLPNLKSVNPTQDTKRGLSNLGNALLGLDMDEWAGSYAEQSFDLFDAASYRFISNRFEDNPIIFNSANYQSFLLNPMSIGFDTRYQDIVLRPQHNLHFGTRLGMEDGRFAGMYTLIQEGYVRKPFEIDYLLQIDLHDNDGFRDNADSEGYFVTFGLGGQPNYKNGFFIFGSIADKETGDPGTRTMPDDDDYTRQSSYSVNAGYNRRLGQKNNLLVNFYISNLESDFHNKDPLGSSGEITTFEASFIRALGLEKSRQIFKDGLYEVDFSLPWYATDSTGTLADWYQVGFSDIPKILDTSLTRRSETTFKSTGFQVKHIVEIADAHQLSSGFELLDHSIETRLTESMSVWTLSDLFFELPYIGYTDEFFGPFNFTPVPFYDTGKVSSRPIWLHGDMWMAYVDDRWKLTDDLLVEAGLFYESYKDEYNDCNSLNPRVGFAWKVHPDHILRAAYQHRIIPSDPTFAPFTTAGVGFEYARMELFPGAELEDYRASLESKWNKRLFTELRFERRYIQVPSISSFVDDYDNKADIVALAANFILSDKVGLFARYKNTDNRNLNGIAKKKEMPYEPENTFGTGVVLVLPNHMKATLSTNYISEQFTDFMNMDGEIPDYWTANFNFTWEPFNKHLLVSFDAKDIFDTYYETDSDVPGMGNSYYLTLEYRF